MGSARSRATRSFRGSWQASARSQRESREKFFATLADQLLATVHKVERLTPTIVEVVVRAPLAARRIPARASSTACRTSRRSRPSSPATRMQMEGLAMTGAWVDRDKGLVSIIALEMGGSTDLCAMLKPGEPVILMGPTGTPDRDRRAARR